jgi:hypothetical protein
MFPFKEHFVITCCGPRGSGKSYFNCKLLEDEEFHLRFDRIFIISPSNKLNNDYYTRKLKRLDHIEWISSFNESDIDDIFEEQRVIKELEISAERQSIRIAERCPETLVLLDDIIDSGLIRFTGSVDKIAERGRHVNISLILCSQRISAVSRSIRINSDYFFVFRPFSISETERFFDDFIERDKRKALRMELQRLFAVRHQFIMVDNHTEVLNERLKTGKSANVLNDSLTVITLQHP